MAEGITLLYTCEICGQPGLTETEMRAHMQVQHVEGIISCPICDLEGITADEMNLHVNTAHLDLKTPDSFSSDGFPEDFDRTKNDSEKFEYTSKLVEQKNLTCLKNSNLQENISLQETPEEGSCNDLSPISAVTSSSAASDGLQVLVSPLEEEGWHVVDSVSEVTELDMGSSHARCQNEANDGGDCETHAVPMDISVDELKVGNNADISEVISGNNDRTSYVSKVSDSMMMSISTTGSDSVTSPDRAVHMSESSDSLELDDSAGFTGSRTVDTKVDSFNRTINQDDLRSKLVLDFQRSCSPKKTGAIPKNTTNAILRLSPANLDNQACAASPSEVHQCPFCDWSTPNDQHILEHVNHLHQNILSPAKPQDHNLKIESNRRSTSHNTKSLKTPDNDQNCNVIAECPICGHSFTNTSLLEFHVNREHVDILSPAVTPLSETLDSPGCPVCGMEFADVSTLNSHVNGHFSTEQTPVMEVTHNQIAQEMARRNREARKHKEHLEFQKLQAEYGMDGKSNIKKQASSSLQKAVTNGQISVSEYYDKTVSIYESASSGVDGGHSKTAGIMARLRGYYVKRSPNICNVYLCSYVDHYGASYGDRGWGCGYRNLQMMLSSLAQSTTYQKVLFNGRPLIPSITKIQQLLETAWNKGFDQEGCDQLGGRVKNTNKWIGATEIMAILCSLKVKAQLIDFHHPSDPNGAHPKLFEWVRNYFKKTDAFKPPLYLQHQGHSRTIVGLEELTGGATKLLIFDPSCSRKQMVLFHGTIDSNLMRTLRRTSYGLKAKQYQIVMVNGILTDEEYNEAKVLKSERIS